ncbi:hypothetical protein J2X02_003610 [Pseudoxanthomonas japonensis]|jgi:hypothetical protein|uniref:hypothetical protein n=1 Tax=Pseudoxanthomonas TaxID=83618 RepID=UPI0007861B32|nr:MULTISPECIES: hypothetical protein [Pseudoxanthomonas]MBA3930739.1 hypothetical protein [Xanthomonas sp.]MBL8257263.1 hypothetical protein [Pseudoxanthomonas mexicana]MDR7070741.1 hypothetical protein [Pseudoxanthomonas japonensis]
MVSQYARSTHSTAQIVDIDAELAYWKTRLNEDTFQVVGATVGDLERCLKIGYDAYLLHHRQEFEEIAPSLRDRLQRDCPDTPIGWYRAQPIMRAVWQRLKPTPTMGRV